MATIKPTDPGTFDRAVMLLGKKYHVLFHMLISESLAAPSEACHYLAFNWPWLANSNDPSGFGSSALNRRFVDLASGRKGLGLFLDSSCGRVGMYLFDINGVTTPDFNRPAPEPLHQPLVLTVSPTGYIALANAIKKELSVMLGIEEGMGL